MSKEITNNSNKVYYSVIDGTLRTRVEESHPQAVKREVELKDGSKKVKYERIVGALCGKIEDVYIQDGDYGKTVNITLDVNGEGKQPVVQFNLENSRYGKDFLKKLPNIKLDEEVMIRPFSFQPEGEDRKIQGVEIKQNDRKVDNYFWDSTNKKPKNGFPELKKAFGDMSENERKIHFLQADEFVENYITEKILCKFRSKEVAEKEATPDYPADEINPEDIPF